MKNNTDVYETEENQNEKLNEPKLLDDKFKKYSSDHKVWWPIKLFYGRKKYYINSNAKFLSNKSTWNHRINIVKKIVI